MEQVAAFARDVAISLIPLRNGSVRLSLCLSLSLSPSLSLCLCLSLVRAAVHSCYKYVLGDIRPQSLSLLRGAILNK